MSGSRRQASNNTPSTSRYPIGGPSTPRNWNPRHPTASVVRMKVLRRAFGHPFESDSETAVASWYSTKSAAFAHKNREDPCSRLRKLHLHSVKSRFCANRHFSEFGFVES